MEEITMVVKNMRDLRLIRMATAGMNRKDIAIRLGVSRQTVGRWLRESNIQQMIQRYSQRQFELEWEFLQKLRGVVVDVLQEIIIHGNNAEKLRAIEIYWKKLGEISTKIDITGNLDIYNRDTEELEKKVEELRGKLYELIGREHCTADNGCKRSSSELKEDEY